MDDGRSHITTAYHEHFVPRLAKIYVKILRNSSVTKRNPPVAPRAGETSDIKGQNKATY